MNARTTPRREARLALVRQALQELGGETTGLTARVRRLLSDRERLTREVAQHHRDVAALTPEERAAYDDAVAGTGAPRP